jgi:hypothetical protein
MDIVYINFNHPSFNWGNGLYIVVSKDYDQGIYNLCRLDENGEPELDHKGDFSISCTGLKNKGIKMTNLKYFTDKQLRAEKLKKINKYGR